MYYVPTWTLWDLVSLESYCFEDRGKSNVQTCVRSELCRACKPELSTSMEEKREAKPKTPKPINP